MMGEVKNAIRWDIYVDLFQSRMGLYICRFHIKVGLLENGIWETHGMRLDSTVSQDNRRR
jgi:hypothetical protein